MSARTRRLFLAVSLPAALARRLAELVPAGSGVRLVPPGALHLTLQFLGDVAETTIRHLTASLDGVRAAPFAVALADRGRFPPRGPAKVLWIGLRDQPALRSLHADCGQALLAAGLVPETRPFVPHVTLARLTPAAGRRVVETFLAGPAIEPATFVVDRIVLFASERTPTGPRHEPLHVVPLRP